MTKPARPAVDRIGGGLGDERGPRGGGTAAGGPQRAQPDHRGGGGHQPTPGIGRGLRQAGRHPGKLTFRWATVSHSNKSTRWVIARYFGQFNKARQDRWVFGNRQTGGYLHRFAWTNIVRHTIVKHRASPDDPELADYWAWRRRKAPLPINRTALRLYKAQDGRCAICKTTLLAASARPQTPRDWEHWLATTRKTIDVVWNTARTDAAEPRLIHLNCNHHPRQPPGLA